MDILLKRLHKTNNSTIGELFINGVLSAIRLKILSERLKLKIKLLSLKADLIKQFSQENIKKTLKYLFSFLYK